MCRKLGITDIKKSTLMLKDYSDKKINNIGKVDVKCKMNGITKMTEFQVVEGNYAPILGLETSANEFKLIKRLNFTRYAFV